MPDAEQIRERVFGRLRVPESTMALWIEPGKATGVEGNRLVLSYPPGQFAWVKRRYAALLGEAARNEGLVGVQIVKQQGGSQ